MSEMTLRRDQVTEVSLHRFATEASDIGIRPGDEWPTRIHASLGNGMPFVIKDTVRMGDGEFGGLEYKQLLGCVFLTVFND